MTIIYMISYKYFSHHLYLYSIIHNSFYSVKINTGGYYTTCNDVFPPGTQNFNIAVWIFLKDLSEFLKKIKSNRTKGHYI